MNLKSKAISGVIWISVSKLFLKLINFVVMIVLARLLDPADFGLVALAMIFVTFFETTRDLGMESALIHYDGDEHNENLTYNTAFILYPAVALFLYCISYLCAPFAAAFFESENLEIVTKVLLLTIVIWSFGSLPRTLLLKNLEFKKMFFPQVLPKTTYGLVAILMAYAGYGVWSLVIGRIVLEVTSVFTYWKSLKWRPSLVFSKDKAIELLSFGKFVAAAGVIAFLLSSIDVVLIGKILGPESLGYYTVALSIAGMFTVQAALILSQVVFSTYSKIQNDTNQLGNSHLKVIKIFSLFVFPVTFGLISIAPYFIEVIYGAKWLPAVFILQILCFHGMITSFNKINSTIFLAVGKPKIMAKINYLQLLLLCFIIYPLTLKYGIIGTSLAITFAAGISMIYSFNESCLILQKSVYDMANNILIPIKGSLLMLLFVFGFQYNMSSLSSEIMLLLNVLIGVLVYGIYLLLIFRKNLSLQDKSDLMGFRNYLN